MKKLSNIETELKKSVAYKKIACIDIKNIKVWHLLFCKTYDHLIWTVGRSKTVDSFETK